MKVCLTPTFIIEPLFYNKKSKSLKFLQKGVDKSQKVNYYIVKVERTKGQRDKEIYNEVIVMGFW